MRNYHATTLVVETTTISPLFFECWLLQFWRRLLQSEYYLNVFHSVLFMDSLVRSWVLHAAKLWVMMCKKMKIFNCDSFLQPREVVHDSANYAQTSAFSGKKLSRGNFHWWKRICNKAKRFFFVLAIYVFCTGMLVISTKWTKNQFSPLRWKVEHAITSQALFTVVTIFCIFSHIAMYTHFVFLHFGLKTFPQMFTQFLSTNNVFPDKFFLAGLLKSFAAFFEKFTFCFYCFHTLESLSKNRFLEARWQLFCKNFRFCSGI